MRIWLVALVLVELTGCAHLASKQHNEASSERFVFKPISQWQLQLGNYVAIGEVKPEVKSDVIAGLIGDVIGQKLKAEYSQTEQVWRFLSQPYPSQTEVVFDAQGLVEIIRLDGRELKLSLVKQQNEQDNNKQMITVLLDGLIDRHYECQMWQQQYQGRWQIRSQYCPASGAGANTQPAHMNKITYDELTQWVPFLNQIITLETIN